MICNRYAGVRYASLFTSVGKKNFQNKVYKVTSLKISENSMAKPQGPKGLL